MLLVASALLTKAWFRLLVKPTYMMEMTQFSRSALGVEKGYKLLVTAVMAVLSFVMGTVIFWEEFSRWPVSFI